jgi:hypothetical protein
MKKQVVTACAAMMVGVGFSGCAGMGGSGGPSLFSKLGGQNVNSMASDLVGKTMTDPRLAGLTGGRDIDPTASSSKVSNQLCSMLGGGCKAPLDDTQLADAAGKVTPAQSRAISEAFDSSLSSVTQDPSVRDSIREAVGDRIPGVIGGLL